MTPQHLTAQKMKEAYYLTQKIPDQVGDWSPTLVLAQSMCVQSFRSPGQPKYPSSQVGFFSPWGTVMCWNVLNCGRELAGGLYQICKNYSS